MQWKSIQWASMLALGLAGCGGTAQQPVVSTGETDENTWAHLEMDGEAVVETPSGKVSAFSHPIGAGTGRAPAAVVFNVSRPLFEGRRGDELPEGVVVSVNPPLPVSVTVSGPGSLVVKPEAGFLPGQAYTVSLDSVRLPSGEVLSSEGRWTYEVQAPEFNFVRAYISSPLIRSRQFEASVQFSGAVDLASVRDRIGIQDAAGRSLPIASVRHDPADPARLKVIFSPSQATGGQYTLAVGPGYTHLGDAAIRGAGGQAAMSLAAVSKPIKIKSVHLVEGATSHSIEVICDDDGSTGYKRYRYLRHLGRSFRTTPRCLPTEESARQFIEVEPAIPFSVSQTAGGFRLLGNFDAGAKVVRLLPGLSGVDGGSLVLHNESELVVPPLQPTVGFTSVGRYLPRDAWSSMPIQHRNVDQLDIKIRHVPESNLLFWLSGDDETADARDSMVVAERTVPVGNVLDERQTTWVDLDQMLPSPEKGVYQISVEAGGTSSTARLLMTDLQLVAKGDLDASDKLWVWALDTHEATNRVGVRVSAVRASGQVLTSCMTTEDGCVLTIPKDDLDETAPIALVARDGNDLTYLGFSEVKTDISESPVHGEAYDAERPYRASVYTDRGVYRPGEVVHLAGIVRGEDRKAPPSGMPLDFELRDPRGKLIRTLARTANSAGMFYLDLEFADYAATGSYSVDVKAGKFELGRARFLVEEFVPERMEVTAAIDDENVLQSDPVMVNAKAKYLFGGSAEGSRVELACSVSSTRFVSKKHAGFQFGEAAASGQSREIGRVDGILDQEGEATLACPVGSALPPTAALTAQIAVFEAGSGRTTNQTTRTMTHASPYYIGVRPRVETAKQGESFVLDGVVVGLDGEVDKSVSSVDLTFQAMSEEWGYVYDEEYGYDRYQSIYRALPGTTQQVAVKDGAFSLNLTPAERAFRYRVIVKTERTRSVVEVDGERDYWWWWGDEEGQSQDRTPRPVQPGLVELKAPDTIEVDKDATVRFIAPFAGRALVSVEADTVLVSRWLDVAAGENEWTFRLNEFRENVYASVLVVKDPHAESPEAYLPERAFGTTSIRVKPSMYVGTLALSVPEVIRSDSKLDVEVDLGKGNGRPRFVTVAAVDEGILSLTQFKSPDPTEALFPKRALGVDTWETIGWALQLRPRVGQGSTGGDADGMEPGGRVQMVKPVSVWSGMVEVPDSGKVTVSMDIPKYRGKLRVMAVAAGERTTAHADAQVTVRDPITLQTTLPRFLASGDIAEIPVFLTNMSGSTKTVALSLDAERISRKTSDDAFEPLTFVGASTASITLQDGESSTSVFRVRTAMRVGALRMNVRAVAGDIDVSESIDLPVEMPAPRARTTRTVSLVDGENDLTGEFEGWLEGTERSSVWVTANPYGSSFGHLKHVVRYPYGCIEQTTSSTRPLLYAGKILRSTNPELVAESKIEDMVQHGVERLINMQTPSGGFAYWMGGSEPTPWGTAYATHMLLDADKAGFAVPKANVQDAIDYLDREVRTANVASWTDPHHGGLSPGGAAYMHYVLAKAGRGNKKQMLNLLQASPEVPDGAAAEAKYLLMAGLYLSGDRRFEKELKNPDLSPVVDERRNDWTFYSDRRRRAFQLAVYTDLFGRKGERSMALATVVADALKGDSRRYTTQEIAWAMTGLARLVGDVSKDHQVELQVGTTKAAPSSKNGDTVWELVRASERNSLALSVSKGEGDLFAIIQSEGVREGAQWRFGGTGLRVTRRYFNLSGDEIDLDQVVLGDVIYATVEISNTSSDRIQNIALVDRVPAGWEIENPRLGRGGSSAEWIERDALWKADHMNVRDDRVEMFGALNRGESRTVVYQVRAVTSGVFTVPPVEAEAMYDPRIWARAPGDVTRIRGAWEGFYL